MATRISKIHARLMGRFLPPKAQEVAAAVAPAAGTHDGDSKTTLMKRVVFMGRSAVARHMFGPDDVLISISDSGIEPPALAHQPREMIALAFHDYVTDNEANDLGWRRMNREDGQKVVEFVLKHTDAPNIIVHCNVGESRSKGAALAISDFTERVAFHVSDNGRITQHKRDQYDFFNRRVYEMILMEHMRLDSEAVA